MSNNDGKKSQTEILEEAAAAAKNAADVDGFYEIEETSEGVFICVHPPQGKGFPASAAKVEAELEILGVIDLDLKKVNDAVAKKAGIKVVIAPPQAGRDADAALEVVISEDKMKASITVIPPKGKGGAPMLDSIKAALREKGVVWGIDEAAIANIIEKKLYNEAIEIAVGTLPQVGENGQVEYQFRTEKAENKPTELKDGSVDFYNLDLVENVIEGQIIAIKIPPREGTSGKTVLGGELPAKAGKAVEFLFGKNVKVSEEDPSLLVATKSGQAVLSDRRVTVVELYQVRGDVDYATGNVTFVGSIKINGNVRSGFEVKAGGNVEINGIVENAKIEAGGSVSVRGGVFGQGTGKIEAEGDIKVKFVDNALLKTKGSVFASQALMHSQVIAEKKVVVTGKGALVGGVTRAGEEVKARFLGSEGAVATEIEVGINPSLRDDYFNLQATIKKNTANYDKVNKGIKTLEQLKAQLRGKFPADKQEMLDKFIQVEAQLRILLESSKARFEELDIKFEQMRGGRIIVGERIHPGVKVVIGKSVRRFDEEVNNLKDNVLREEKGEIVFTY